jgi:RNA polymerase sigma factor (sigma-70 family)
MDRTTQIPGDGMAASEGSDKKADGGLEVAESVSELHPRACASDEDDWRRIRARLLRTFQNFADVEEAIQEAYQHLHEKDPHRELVEKRRAYVYQAARYWLIDRYRKEQFEQRQQAALEYELTASSIADPLREAREREWRQSRLEALPKALELVVGRDRQCWDLFLAGHTLHEIAKQTGLTTPQAASRAVGRARKRMKGYLDENA